VEGPEKLALLVTECVLDLKYIRLKYLRSTSEIKCPTIIKLLCQSTRFTWVPILLNIDDCLRLVVTTLCFLNYIFSSEVKHFRNLLSASKVWELKKDERIKLAYVFQSSHREKACKEFLDVSQAYMQVNARFAYRL